jgi:hypothetical protein
MAVISRRDFFRDAAIDGAATAFLAARGAELRANPLRMPMGISARRQLSV